MIQKTTLSLFRFILIFSIFLCTKTTSHAQTIVPQQLDGVEKMCAGASFNTYNATFIYVDFPANTTFVIEMSKDNFTTIIGTTKIAPDNNVSPTQQTITFSIPSDLVGADNYSLRVKSSTGTVSPRFKNSQDNTSFPAHYKSYESLYSINKKNGSAVICTGSSMTLTVDNDTPEVAGSSPALFPNLKYRWYKDDVLIAGQSSSSLVVNATGEYYSQIDYGLCSETNVASNHVIVTSTSSGSAVTIDSSLGNPFCDNGTGTVLTATASNNGTYVWKKNGVVMSGVTTRSITTNESAIYSVDVNFGICTATGTIDLKSNGFNASIDVADEFDLNPGETKNVTVTTDASAPTYEWFLNETLINGATTNSYLVAVKGNYKVKISQAGGCLASKEFTFRAKGQTGTATVIPNIVSLTSYPYWDLPDEYQNPNTKVIILSSQGQIVFEGVDYDSSKWVIQDFKNVNPVYYYVIQSDTGEKKGSITVIK